MKAHALAKVLLDRPDVTLVISRDGFDWDILSVTEPRERDDIHPENREVVVELFTEF